MALLRSLVGSDRFRLLEIDAKGASDCGYNSKSRVATLVTRFLPACGPILVENRSFLEAG